MKVKNLYFVLSLLIAMSMLLVACAPQVVATTETQAPVATEEPTEVAATAAPTEEPVTTERHGGWLDEIDVSVVAGESAISQIQADAIDFYSFALASDSYPAIQE